LSSLRDQADASLPAHLVLYDGDCGLCARTVAWLIARDPTGLLRFAPLQGTTAEALFQRLPEMPRDLSTIQYLERTDDGERLHLRSHAFFRLCRLLEGPVRHLSLLRLIPSPLADIAYGLLARHRQRLSPPLKCDDGENAERFLP
jgi:predicted DCC family thiol-disulfide oxidoreductase YuxK